MLDNPEKVEQLMTLLEACLPFEVELTPSLIQLLHSEHNALAGTSRHAVSEVYYHGDAGGIMCRIAPPDGGPALFVSLTHLRVRPSSPLARPIAAYQKHRLKKLKQDGIA
jgi:hypothetical protein